MFPNGEDGALNARQCWKMVKWMGLCPGLCKRSDESLAGGVKVVGRLATC